jgi:hypothetical protein
MPPERTEVTIQDVYAALVALQRPDTVAGESPITAQFHVRRFVLRLVMWVNYHDDKRR